MGYLICKLRQVKRLRRFAFDALYDMDMSSQKSVVEKSQGIHEFYIRSYYSCLASVDSGDVCQRWHVLN